MDIEEILHAAKGALVRGEADDADHLTAPLFPEHADRIDANYLRAATLIALGDTKGAEAHLEAAWISHAVSLMEQHQIDVSRMASDPDYALQVAMMFYRENYVGPASLASACAVGDTRVAADGGLFLHGQILQHMGRVDAALATFERAWSLTGAGNLPGFILYSTFFVKNGVQRHAQAAKAWGSAASQFTPENPTYQVGRNTDRKLRIGYVAPSFQNQVRQFFLPVVAHHDTETYEIFAYVNDPAVEELPDHVTVRAIKRSAPDEAAALIRDDAIDVLVDVWGHAAGGHLLAFAHRPAPVQVAWLNYLQTTGLPAMDYSLMGKHLMVPGTQDLFAETVFEMGPCLVPYRASASARTSPTPALERGFLVFGSFNHPAKISDETVTGWSKVLKACPGSKLLFKYSFFIDPLLQATTQCRFLGHGVDPADILFAGHSKGDEYEQSFAEIDIALDPVSCPGGTTTVEAFSRGVPLIGVEGRDFYSRITVEALHAIGMPELLCADWDDAAAKAAAFAADIPALDALRARVRPGLDASPYADEADVTRRLEAAYRTMFETWAASA